MKIDDAMNALQAAVDAREASGGYERAERERRERVVLDAAREVLRSWRDSRAAASNLPAFPVLYGDILGIE